MNLNYRKKLQIGLFVFAFILFNNFLFSQTIEPFVHLSTESNGVELYFSNGFENSELETLPEEQPMLKSVEDYSLEEIVNILIDIEFKLEQYQNSNDQESIDLLLSLQALLIEQKTILSNQN
jgi:hypothetical protein